MSVNLDLRSSLAACRAEMSASGFSPFARPFLAIESNTKEALLKLSLRLQRNFPQRSQGFPVPPLLHSPIRQKGWGGEGGQRETDSDAGNRLLVTALDSIKDGVGASFKTLFSQLKRVFPYDSLLQGISPFFTSLLLHPCVLLCFKATFLRETVWIPGTVAAQLHNIIWTEGETD